MNKITTLKEIKFIKGVDVSCANDEYTRYILYLNNSYSGVETNTKQEMVNKINIMIESGEL